jgi:CheY-like chemotaxis protein
MVVEKRLEMVMLVDDDPTDNFIAKRILQVSGFAKEVIVKGSVSEALEYLKNNAVSEETLPEIIFLDINMPLYGGFDFLEEFEKLNVLVKRKSKIIILSSSDNKKDIERIIANDYVIKFITKPISEETLEEIHLKNA